MDSSAKRYAVARPYVHATALARFQTFAPIHFPVERALDVGCGTGQSTEALLRFAESAAETTHDGDERFDLITVARAFQGFDQEAFLAEARRVLR